MRELLSGTTPTSRASHGRRGGWLATRAAAAGATEVGLWRARRRGHRDRGGRVSALTQRETP